MTATTCLITYFSISQKKSINSLKTTQDQLYFSNWMRLRINLGVTESSMLLGLNGTLITENKSAGEQYAQTLRDCNAIEAGVFGLLYGDVSDYSFELSNVLFANGCNDLSAGVMGICTQMQASVSSPSFIQFLYKFEDLVHERYQQYAASDKSREAILSIIGNLSQPLFMLCGILSEQAGLISNIIDEKYEHDSIRAKRACGTNLAVFAIFLVTIALVSWLCLFRKRLETGNEFKKILRAFPADVVLGNFILKLFLLRSSKDVLNTIRHRL